MIRQTIAIIHNIEKKLDELRNHVRRCPLLQRVTAVEYSREVGSGKSRPALIVAQSESGEFVELVAKFAESCERKEIALAVEVIGACLAGDLGLPVPEPLIVELPVEWLAVLPKDYRSVAGNAAFAFGSKLVSGQWPHWSQTSKLSETMVQTAASIFAFDALIDNVDRRNENPNCLVSGNQIRIFDHEMAWTQKLFASKPWQLGSLRDFANPGNHIFRNELLSCVIDFEAIKENWLNLNDEKIAGYGAAVPVEWANDKGTITRILTEISEVRNNIDACFVEIERVLQ